MHGLKHLRLFLFPDKIRSVFDDFMKSCSKHDIDAAMSIFHSKGVLLLDSLPIISDLDGKGFLFNISSHQYIRINNITS